MQSDALINFLFRSLPVRGVLLQLSDEWRALHRLHDYAPPVRALLGQSLGAAAMIASTMKFEGTLTLQLGGDGALGMLITQCNHDLKVRGMAGELSDGQRMGNFQDLIAGGRLTLTVDARDAKDRYQGIVAVTAASLAGALKDYYRDSAQLGAHFVLLSDADATAALMLQRMPDDTGLSDDDWRRLCLLADTLTLDELKAGMDHTMLTKLFAEDDLLAYAPRAVRFSCRCDDQRAEQAVRMLGEEDARQLLAERGDQIDIVCEFCNRKRTLDAVDIGRIFNPAGMRSDAGIQ